MRKKYITSLILSVTLIFVTLPHITANVEADREMNDYTYDYSYDLNMVATEEIVEPVVNDIVETNGAIEVDRNKPMTVALGEKMIERSSVVTEESINRDDDTTYSRGGNPIETIDFTLSFYSTLRSENGNWTVTCEGIPLKGLENCIANNVLPLHTKIYLEGLGKYEILDHGGKSFNNYNRLDVLVQREKKSNGQWETDKEYLRRVNNMDKVKVKGYVIK